MESTEVNGHDLDDVKLDFAVAVEEALVSSGKKWSDLAKDIHVSGAHVKKYSGETPI